MTPDHSHHTVTWEQRKLNSLGNIVTGSTPKTNNPEYYGGDYLFVSPVDIQNNRNIINTNTKLTKAGRDTGRILTKGASLFVSIGSTIGKVGQLQTSATTNQQINAILPNESNDADFVFSLLEKNACNLKRISATQAVPILNKNTFSKFPVYVPLKAEQRLIGILIRSIDDIIALHERKLELLKELKRGYLEQLFPKIGQNGPNLRFAGFANTWEQYKFKKFVIKSGKRWSETSSISAYSVSNRFGLIPQSEQFDGSILDSLEKTSYKVVNENEFAYNPARINVGSIAFNNLGKSVIVSSLYVVFKSNNILDNEYVLQYIQTVTFKNEVRRNTEGSVRAYLFFDSFSNIRLPYTKSITEQQDIGVLLRKLDQAIALHQHKLELVKKLKYAYLQKLFM